MSARTGVLKSLLLAAAVGLGPSAWEISAQESHHHHPPPPSTDEETVESERPPGIPPITDADREAAFPDVHGHTVHDDAVNTFILFDQLEWRDLGTDSGGSWDADGWIGKDRDRFWFRIDGESDGDDPVEGSGDFLYGRAVARWWDLVAGVRHDVGAGPDRTWAAVGIQGLAPYWFELEATAYLGESGRTRFRLETEYDLLLTNRLVLQPLVELDVYGKSDPERGIGAGLSTIDVGLRLRYEIRRELAPYVGVEWNRQIFGTADLARAAGDDTGAAALLLGVRLWF